MTTAGPRSGAAAETSGALPPLPELALMTVIFWLCYTQLQPYASTQNTYFLRGLARAGVGALASDWLAHTADPVPVFSGLVEWTARTLRPWAYHVFSILLFGVYLQSLFVVAALTVGRSWGRLERRLYFATLTILHSAALGFASMRLIGFNLPRLLERGVAEQYVLGPVFQPSSFGVFLLLSLVTAGRGRFVAAVVWASIAAIVHPTYLLPALILVATDLVCLLRDRGGRRPLLAAAGLALLLLGPVAAYVAVSFHPTSPGAMAEAQHILIGVRLPHHADVAHWFGPGAIAQLGVIVGALALSRRSPLGRLLAWPLAAGVALTLVQVLTHDPSLALLFPWRISVVLVPLSTAVLLALAVEGVARSLRPAATAHPRLAELLVGGMVALLALVGIVSTRERWAPAEIEPAGVTRAARATAAPRDLYLVPPEWEQFRIAAGVPLFVDMKNHPVRDVEVVEWYRRVLLARRLYESPPDSACLALERIRSRDPITHVVDRVGHLDTGRCPDLRELYRDRVWVIYGVASSRGGGRSS